MQIKNNKGEGNPKKIQEKKDIFQQRVCFQRAFKALISDLIRGFVGPNYYVDICL